MDIKSFRVENGELTITIGVSDHADAMRILDTLMGRGVETLSTIVQPEPPRTIAVDRPAAMRAAALNEDAVAVVAVKPVAIAAPTSVPVVAVKPAAAAAPVSAPAEAPKRRGRPPKVRPETTVAVVPAAIEESVGDIAPEVLDAIATVELPAAQIAVAVEVLDDEEEAEDDGFAPEEEAELSEDAPVEVAAPAPVEPPAPARVQLHAVPKPSSVVKPLLKDGNTQILIAKLVEFTKLRDVLYTLKDSGYTTPNELADVCEELQQDVPVLQRITGLRDRVLRAVPVLGI